MEEMKQVYRDKLASDIRLVSKSVATDKPAVADK
jgi:hypothetical protein